MSKIKLLLSAVSFFALSSTAMAKNGSMTVKNIVLVHGAFADGSGWKSVTNILRHDGYTVSVVQEPETSLADDVAATNRILDRQNGPTVLVGHSYGGTIITEAGNNNHVASLVYVAAFAPDMNENMLQLATHKPAAANSISPIGDGYLAVDPMKFHDDFAADVPVDQTKYMAISQVPLNGKIFGTAVSSVAWKNKPSYGIVATQDRMINPDLERSMYQRAHAEISDIKGSHAIYVSHPKEVANIIEKAARGSH